MIDRAATFWRAHFKPLFVLSFGFSLVNFIATKATTLAIQRLAPLLYSGDAQSRSELDPMTLLGDAGVAMALWAVLFVFLFWSYWLATLTASRYVVSVHLGEPVRPGDALRRAFSRVGPLTGAYVISLGWSTLVTLLFLVPGAVVAGLGIAAAVASGSNVLGAVLGGVGALLAGLGLIAAMLWYFLRFLLLPPVMAMEDVGAWEAFRRSGALLSGRVEPGFLGRVVVRAMVLYTVMSLILISVQLVSQIPTWLVLAQYGSPFDAGTLSRTPQYLLVPAELLQVAAQACFTPIYFVFCSIFYLDMRVRREGLDLERRMEAPSAAPQAA
ncbi:hypothetical protein K8638_07745 [Myxococcus sp. RHST-1-4]|nr:hypothetical protein [Myxococcus sp. RHSTA-1-4]MBZ4416374.1 hypothetical protein [Myxococcus sp. RHSTA-1-4]